MLTHRTGGSKCSRSVIGPNSTTVRGCWQETFAWTFCVTMLSNVVSNDDMWQVWYKRRSDCVGNSYEQPIFFIKNRTSQRNSLVLDLTWKDFLDPWESCRCTQWHTVAIGGPHDNKDSFVLCVTTRWYNMNERCGHIWVFSRTVFPLLSEMISNKPHMY